MVEHFGELTHTNGYVTAVMERKLFDTHAADIWPMLTEQELRVKWLAPGTIDLFVGGRAKLDFKDSYILVDSEVTQCLEPHCLAFSWSDRAGPKRPVSFELMDVASDGCIVKLTISIPDSEVVARSCAGWEAHLTMLQAAIAGVSIKFPLDRFKASREFFDNQLAMLMMSEVPALRL